MSRFSAPTLWTILSLVLLSLLISCTASCSSEPERSPVKTGEGPVAEENTIEKPEIPIPEDVETAADVLETRYSDVEDTDQALAALEKVDIESMDPDSRLVYAVLLRTQGRLDESREQLGRLIDENPLMAEAWFNLALVEHAQGNTEARDRALDSAIEADSSMAEALAFRGALAVSRSRWSEAENDYKSALKQNPESVESLMGLAWVLAKTERINDALPFLDRAVEIDPEYTYARVDRSRVNVSLGNYNAAEDDLDAAIGQEPEVPWHYLDRARIRLRHFKDYEGALSDLENVERLDPDNFFAMVYLAGLHEEERRFAVSESYYKKVLDMRPNYIWAYMPMGKIAWMRGEYDAAARWFAKASAEDPEEFSFQLMMAVSLLRAGKISESNRQFAEVLRKFERGETAYEVIRFCAERNTDFYAVNALNKETNETLRERLWFYMGAIYEFENNAVGAQTVYERIAEKIGEMEYDLAWAALNGLDG